MLFRRHAKFAVKSVMPHFFHIVPVAYNSGLDRRLNFEDTTLLLGLLADIDFLLIKTDHDTGYFGASDNSGEDRSWGIVTGETCLTLSGTVIDHDSRYLFVHCLLTFF